MNSRQRRGVILLVVSALCAVGAFAGVLAVIHDVDSKVGPETAAYRLKQDVAPYKELTADQFEKVSMPKRWLSSTAVTRLSEIRGKIAVTQLKKGSLLQEDMIVARPQLKSGQQEIAIMIDAETGVAGKIDPGSKVNIYATFKAENDKQRDQSKVIVENAEVMDVGKLTPIDQQGANASGNSTVRRQGEAVPITFALDAADAQRVAYAESFATHVRLALVAPGADGAVPPGDRSYTLDEDK
ncbi:Flp pilus assembly protein CpaB [Streptomyces sp. SID8379]|uniref:Flp pilus assembly protein CpaB n=1 Tax=unclassified Streptomyces TaxID=2593676 RepID=UPI0003643CFE|nr:MULTISPECIES: Flp pilus assembly protein CpaB [unclassified Streptomyces]MYW64826.1 Flp pilus assembly protein CpaB [Streptomyces sp. SID8379]